MQNGPYFSQKKLRRRSELKFDRAKVQPRENEGMSDEREGSDARKVESLILFFPGPTFRGLLQSTASFPLFLRI